MSISTPMAGPQDAQTWASQLGISREAVELYLASDVIDLHVDSFIWSRIFRYDLTQPHGSGLFAGRYYSMVDFPRARRAGLSGAIWSITTSPLRGGQGRARAFERNQARLRQIIESAPEDIQLVRNHGEYLLARQAGRHAAFVGIQGGNALDADEQSLDLIQDDMVIQVTLVHLSTSSLGQTSAPSPARGQRGLTDRGRQYIEQLNERRIFVDLAHISREGFFDALEVHDPGQPLLVTHTGVSACHDSWRNVDDQQLRAVADTGGTVGVIFHGGYLGGPYLSGGSADLVARHLEHIVRTVGEDHASLGSDWDGMIVTPRDMPTCMELPVLVQRLLDRGLNHDCIGKILGGNFLRALKELRG